MVDEQVAKSAGQITGLHVRILRRIVRGESYQRIATVEYVSKRTVCRQVAELKQLAGVSSSVGLGI